MFDVPLEAHVVEEEEVTVQSQEQSNLETLEDDPSCDSTGVANEEAGHGACSDNVLPSEQVVEMFYVFMRTADFSRKLNADIQLRRRLSMAGFTSLTSSPNESGDGVDGDNGGWQVYRLECQCLSYAVKLMLQMVGGTFISANKARCWITDVHVANTSDFLLIVFCFFFPLVCTHSASLRS